MVFFGILRTSDQVIIGNIAVAWLIFTLQNNRVNATVRILSRGVRKLTRTPGYK